MAELSSSVENEVRCVCEVRCVGKNMSQWEFPKIPFLVLVSSSILIYYWLINELHFLFPSPTRTVCVGIPFLVLVLLLS